MMRSYPQLHMSDEWRELAPLRKGVGERLNSSRKRALSDCGVVDNSACVLYIKRNILLIE